MRKVTTDETDTDPLSRWSSVEAITLATPPLPQVNLVPAPPRIPSPRSRTAAFRARFFPTVTTAEWADWRWQLKHRVVTLAALERFIRLAPEERDAAGQGGLPLAITPYYLSLVDPDDTGCPIRRSVVPTTAELASGVGESADPLCEDDHSPVPGLVHRYPDRVLFLATSSCSTYCRYCTRSRLVGSAAHAHAGRSAWEKGIEYVRNHPEVRDVLVSGGDPLLLEDEQLEWLLTRLRAIPHVELLRLGTKIPVVMPQRVTPSLARLLARFHPLWMSLHFTHPEELTPEVARACRRLANAGIPLGSQTVLLKGINDDVPTLKALFHGLLRLRVKPYYLFQCDPIPGSGHFRTPVATGLDMIRGLRGHTSGYAVPTFAVDAPGGGGKIPLLPDYGQGHDGDDLVLRNYEGRLYRYPDPSGP
jgi:lysine 2,3-aminomutase